MNREDAAETLREYIRQATALRRFSWPSKDRKAAMAAMHALMPKVNAVLRELLADIEPIRGGQALSNHMDDLRRVIRADHILQSWYRMTVVSPEGVELVPPTMPLVALDPMVVSVAEDLWRQEKYRQAVSDAAGKINEFLQNRLGRHDISDSDLMAQAFKPEPPEPGSPRLRCPGNPKSLTVQSMQDGAKLFAMGCFKAIRNPASHGTGDGNPVTAFEQLAALSIVARWVQHWKKVEHSVPISSITFPAVSVQKTPQQKPPGKGAPAPK